MTFCDLATFYCQTGGGIRTYYDAKLDWFRHQRRHRYVLVVPGHHSSVRALTPWVTIVQVRGMRLGRAADRYRLFIDLAQIRATVRACRPDVVEAGDAWVSGPLALWLRRVDHTPRSVSSFFHSDPIATYVEPALGRAAPRRIADGLSRIADRAFNRLQAQYDVTMVSSSVCADRLTQTGVTRVCWSPFGVDSTLFAIAACRRTIDRGQRLLYVGRSDHDKQVSLLASILPRLLARRETLFVTVAGTGRLRSTFERFTHPRFRYVGYVRDRAGVAALYHEHDILLAPGAHETFGLSALEAAAAGLIIVGPDQGGIGALLREMQSPFTFRAGDPEGFLAAVSAALEADWTRASEASRSLAARYGTWPEAIARLVGAYERLLGEVVGRDET